VIPNGGRRHLINPTVRHRRPPLPHADAREPIGLQFGALLGGAVITETIFAWPGVGRLTIQAVQTKDLPLVQACVLLLASIFVFANLVVDILYAYLDPRIRMT
jgi:peptide/nickel transport system permease protein